MTRRALVAGAALAALMAAAAAPLPAAADPPPNPIDEARAAAARLSFVGVVEVTWSDRSGAHTDQMVVRGQDGWIEVQGATTALADTSGASMIRRQTGGWDLLWSSSPVASGRPDPSAKYVVQPAAGDPVATVASRPTRVLDVRQGSTLVERLFLDTATGLLLRREQVGTAATTSRVVAFSALQLDPPGTVPPPPDPVDHSPSLMSVTGGGPAPATLPGGYRRLGAYREQGVVQLLYSDGLYDLSVFEQPGGLAVPSSGTRIPVGSGHAWIYGWPGGHILLRHAGHTLYSLVSDAPVEHLEAAAAALPAAGGSSLVGRLRQVCRSLLEPLAG
ncbi:MAG: hypothetical protein ABR511_14560 [Acidimicrobiales bacterium]